VSAGAIAIDGLARRFGAVQAVKPVHTRIEPGTITGLLGPNGSGKSTLLRMLLGLVRPDAGGCAVDGVPLRGDGLAIRRRVTYVPGELHVYTELRGRAHLAWCLRGRGRAALARALELARGFELPLGERLRAYSHGMKRQLLLCAALAPEVRVRILDEPTEGLDPTRRGQVLELLFADVARGTTILLSSHHLGEVERACQRRLFLRAGELLDEQHARALEQRSRECLRVHWSQAPDPRALERALSGLGLLERRLDGERASFFFPSAEAGRRGLRALLEQLPAPRALSYGELSLAELYRELYGTEGV
jgi:ABC-2 type transport system ATP-binding protein